MTVIIWFILYLQNTYIKEFFRSIFVNYHLKPSPMITAIFYIILKQYVSCLPAFFTIIY